MTCVNIFLACFEEGLRDDTLEISSFIQTLNNLMIKRDLYFKLFIDDGENTSASAMKAQEIENAISQDSQLVVFLFYKKVNQYLQVEFEAAYEHLKECGTPAVLTFFRTDGTGPTSEVKAFMDNLDQELGYHFKTYSDIDAVKIYLLMQIKNMGMDIPIEFKDNQVYVENTPIVSVEHLPELCKNQDWEKLQEEQDNIEKEFLEAKSSLLEDPDNVANMEQYNDIADRRTKNKEQIKQLEEDIINLTCQSVEDSAKGHLTPSERAAYQLLEQGKYTEAEEVLLNINYNKTNMLIEHLHQQLEKSVDMLLDEIDELIMAENPDRFKEIEAAYEEIVEMEASYNLNRKATQKYIEYLKSHGKLTRGIQLARQYLEYQRQAGDVLAIREAEECLASMLRLMTSSNENLEGAEELYREILWIDRALVKEDPALYTPDLANDCFNLAKRLGHYTDDNSLSEAEDLYREAIAIQQGLAKENPASYEEDLASSCYNLARLLSRRIDDNRLPEIEALYREAIDIQRALVYKNPKSYDEKENLALSYYNLANLLSQQSNVESQTEAEGLYREAIDVQRSQVCEDAALYALCCYNLANLLSHHSDVESHTEAEKLYRTAIGIQQNLAASAPKIYEEDLALSCYNLAELLSFRNDSEGREESESLYSGSLEIYRRLGVEIPDRFKETPLEALSYDTAKDKPESYKGNEPYIFISYARKDEVVVLNIIRKLQNEGFRVFYDEGIVSGSDWNKFISDHIKNCSCVCAFFSEAYWASETCVNELQFAIKLSKPNIGVHIQENKVPGEIQLMRGRVNDIFLYKYYNLQNFFGELADTSVFQNCRCTSSKPEENNSIGTMDEKPKSYTGKDPYIFVSYSHKDDNLILDIIKRLQDQGFRISYDDGEASGTEWDNLIAERIKNCYCICAFFSEAYWASNICMNELRFAIKNSKPHLGVHIQKAEVPAAFQFLLGKSQDIYFYEYNDLQEFLKEMTDLTMLQKCRQIPLESSKTIESAEPAENNSHVAMDEKPKSYTGKEPYIFISYSHKNERLVLDIIKHLQDQGFRVFYDEGIDSGSDWNKYITSRIKDCDCFCAMFSEEYWESNICKTELAMAAQDYDKPNFGIYLQETQIPPELKLIRGLKQDMFYYEYKDEEKFLVKLYSTKMFKNCREEIS